MLCRQSFRFLSSSVKKNKSVGLIGVGHMGEKIAQNLQSDGYDVLAFDKDASKVLGLKQFAVTHAKSIEDIAAQCKIVVSILPNDKVTEAVATELLRHKSNSTEGFTHISCSTVSPSTSRSLEAKHQAVNSNAHFIAAPVFARPDGLLRKQATFLVSGAPEGRLVAHDLLQSLGKSVDYGDDVGAGNVVKLCGNFLIASSIEAIGESMALAEKHGVDRTEVMKLLSSTIFDCLIYKGYGQRVSERDHRPGGFSLDLGLKDMSLVSQAAREVNVPMPFLSSLLDRYTSAKARGREQMDWSAIGLSAAEDAGIDVQADIQRNLRDIQDNRKY